MKFIPEKFAHALAFTAGIAWTACSIFVLLFPAFSFSLTNWLFHGLNILSMDKNSVTFQSFFFGGLIWIAASWLFGYILAWSTNYFHKVR